MLNKILTICLLCICCQLIDAQKNEAGHTEEPIFHFVEQMPMLSCEKCDSLPDKDRIRCAQQELMRKVMELIRFPEEKRLGNYDGAKLYYSFVVNKKGKMQDIQLIKSTSPSPYFEKQGLKAMQQLAEETIWHPGQQQGKPVNVKMTLPIIFRSR